MRQRNCFGGSVVHVGDPAHDREAEVRAGQCPRLGRPVEAIENVRQVVRGNSRAVVADLDFPVGRRDADAAVRRAPFQRVVDQVSDRPFQRVRIAADQRRPEIELVPQPWHPPGGPRCDSLRDQIQPDIFDVERGLPVTRQLDQVVDQHAQLAGFGQRGRGQRRRARVVRLLSEQFVVGDQAGERGAKLV